MEYISWRRVSLAVAIGLLVTSVGSAVAVLGQLLVWRQPIRSCADAPGRPTMTEGQLGSIRGELSFLPFRLECSYLEHDRAVSARTM